MRLRAALALLLAAGLGSEAQGQAPRVGRVTAGGVYVRGGPGQSYYPTARLPRGARVVVYGRDSGGWLAIRPPEGSFSWVSSEDAQFAGGEIATVAVDGARSFVGTELGPERDLWQVKLQRGEVLRVLGEDGSWLKVAPPPGEFRWISSRHVALDTAVASDPADDRADPPAAIEAGEDLAALSLELTRIVCRDPRDWSFEELRSAAGRIAEDSADAEQQAEARKLLARIDRFDEIRQQREAAPEEEATAAEAEPSPVAGRPSSSPKPRDDKPLPLALGRYDGQGKLAPVHSRKDGVPPFALIGGDGRLECFVSPAPGINLNPYAERVVGVTGVKRWDAELKEYTIVARRVQVLPGTKRR